MYSKHSIRYVNNVVVYTAFRNVNPGNAIWRHKPWSTSAQQRHKAIIWTNDDFSLKMSFGAQYRIVSKESVACICRLHCWKYYHISRAQWAGESLYYVYCKWKWKANCPTKELCGRHELLHRMGLTHISRTLSTHINILSYFLHGGFPRHRIKMYSKCIRQSEGIC